MDLVCSSFTGASGSDVLDVAANTRSDVYGMLTRYPEPYSSIYGHITTFSLNVWRCCVKIIKFISILFEFLGMDWFAAFNNSLYWFYKAAGCFES